MSDDDTPPGGSRSQRRKWDSGVYVPVAGLGAILLAFAGFLFNRIETKCEALDTKMEARCDAIETKMEAARAARNAQVQAIERDVVRLQDQYANVIAVLAEIKGDIHTILEELKDNNRRKSP